MLRYALALALGFSIVAVSGIAVSNADEKKDDKKTAAKTVEGSLLCTKCKLGETDKCGNALQVKEGEKTVTYYLADKGKGESYHACGAPKEGVKVTGKIVEKDGKKTIEDAKVELPKKK